MIERIRSLFFLFALLLSASLKAQFTIGGTASSMGNNCYRLTNALNSQAGYVYNNTAINLNQPFDYKFQVYLGTNNGGADGIVFVLRGSLGTPYIGTGGGGLGFENLTGVNVGGTMGVEVDTWQNSNVGDPTFDHIGIISSASTMHTGATALSGAVQASPTSINVEDGNYHTLNIRWNPTTQELDVYLDCSFRIQYQGDLINNVFNGDSTAYWGFVGTTGGANNDQRFCLTQGITSLFTPLVDDTICAGETVQFNAGTSALSYLWSPGASLSNVAVSNPVASPTTSTNYYVTATYQCDTIIDTAHVEVIQANFSATSSVTQPLCNGDCNGLVDLNINGPSSYSYNWNNGVTTEDLSNVCQGSYTVTVVDTVSTSQNYNCYITQTINVNQPTFLASSIINQGKTSCPDGLTCDASAEVGVSGGTAPYSYSWASGENTAVATSLCADSNYVTVTDANGCVSINGAYILIPDSIVTTGFGDTLICMSNQAIINVGSTGGTPPYNYVWYQDSLNGLLLSAQQSFLVNPNYETEYFVVSTDANNCVGDTSNVLVKVRPELGVELPELDTICPYDVIGISAIGVGGDSLYTFSWETGQFGPTINVSPDFPTWYTVTVSDACGTPPYIDSVFIQVGGYADIKATLSTTKDTICNGESIVITATALGGYKGPAEYRFNWSNTTNTGSIQALQPGQTRQYIVTVSDLCISKPGVDTITVFVGSPEIPIIDIKPHKACAEAKVLLSLRSFDQNSRYDWIMGETQVVNHQFDTLSRTFNNIGCYDVSLNITTEFGCESTMNLPCGFEILERPTAAFSVSQENPSNLDPFVLFTNQSINAYRYNWFVQGYSFDNDSALNFSFVPSPFEEEMQLVAYHRNGCTDTANKWFNFKHLPIVYVPSSFSPNDDGLNDVLYVIGENISFQNFEFAIYDRWGHEVFYTKNPLNGWDGDVIHSGEKAPIGVYTYVLRYKNPENEPTQLTGTITIVKTGDMKNSLR